MSASESEGEIIETKDEKATTTRLNSRENIVNHDSRRNSGSSSSEPYTYGRFDGAGSRSPSPYRAKSPRRAKRAREDDLNSGADRHGSRRFKSHHDSGHQHRSMHSKQTSRYGKDRSSRAYNAAGLSSRANSRAKTDSHRLSRSPSPYRHKRDESGISERPRSHGGNRLGSSTTLSTHAKPTAAQAENGHIDADSTSRGTQPAAPQVHAEPLSVDEDALIEERRKRREAVKAKFKGSETPLLVQALQHSGQSAPGTPTTDKRSPRSVRSASPISLGPESAPDSPAAADSTDEVDFTSGGKSKIDSTAAEGPSAADYDPTLDMQEDRAREDKRHTTERSAATYNEELEERDKKVLVPEVPSAEADQKVAKSEFDMFADDDDDDMFAPEAKAQPSFSTVPKPPLVPSDNDPDIDLRDNWDDPDGYYRFNARDALDGRYRPQAVLGRGMFSAVFRAEDQLTKQTVAVKIIRNNETMHKAGYKEIGILKKLADADPDDKRHIIRLLATFEYRNHLCMVFENLNMNLRDVLRKFGRDTGINLKAVRSYARQIFFGLSLLRKCEVLHADIKPDNILINDNRNMLKICDLGSAGDASDNEITPYLVSRFYRAPEIILGMPYDYAIDMWSVGCTLFELCTGKILFTGRNNNQMLKSIMECRGKFTIKMLQKAEFRFDHFDENLERFRSVEKDKVTGRDTVRFYNYAKPVRDVKARVLASVETKHMTTAELRELNLFIDLLDKCLQLNPDRRIVPNDALRHAFLQTGKV